jgi:hypothetical protein
MNMLIIKQVFGMNSIEDCVEKIDIKKINGNEWMLLNKRCDCLYYGSITIHYCRRRSLYFFYHRDKKQLELPFNKKEVD